MATHPLVLLIEPDPVLRQLTHGELKDQGCIVLDPGPNGAALYVSFMKPVLRGADYNIVHILGDELPAPTATTLIDTLRAAPSQPQSTLNLDSILDLALTEAPAP